VRFKIILASALASMGALWLQTVRPWKRGGEKLRNRQGVGPAHMPGVHKGEERVLKEGRHSIDTVAGRIRGSLTG
jgi:hypothetical protein